MNRLFTSIKISGGVIALGGVLCLILAPLIGDNLSDSLWVLEPLTYVGGALLIAGLGVAVASYAGAEWQNRSLNGSNGHQVGNSWSETTLQYFQLFDHDLGRPLRRIAGKERELRAVIQASPETADAGVIDLLDEIERQTPNFRLMMSNIQVLIQLESPDYDEELQPVAAGDQQPGTARKAADVLFGLEHELRGTAVGLQLPGAGRGKARHRQDALDGRHELAHGQVLFDQGTRRRGQVGQAVDPGQFVPVAAHERQAFAGRGDGKGAHGHHAFVGRAVGQREHQAAMGVARECERGKGESGHGGLGVRTGPPGGRGGAGCCR